VSALYLPVELRRAFAVVLGALEPLSFADGRRVLRAAEALIADEHPDDAAKIGQTIFPSIHPDRWTAPPKLPPLALPPRDIVIKTKKRTSSRRKRNPK
jgi:hypothetical protein